MGTFRPRRLVCVLGSQTEVGKTWTAVQVLASLRRRGRRVAARKPVQSFDEAAGGPTDAALLGAASGEDPHTVCPAGRWYPRPLAPPVAAAELGRAEFTVDELSAEIAWPRPVDVGLVETVGGPRSPIACDGDSIDLCERLRPDSVILVADAALGAINAVRLSVAPLLDLRLPTAVVLNRYNALDRVHVLNREWLSRRLPVEVLTDPSQVVDLIDRSV